MAKPALPPGFSSQDPVVRRFLEEAAHHGDTWPAAQTVLAKALAEIHDQPAATAGYCRTALALGVGEVLGWTLKHPAFALRLLRLWACSAHLGESLERQPGLLDYVLALPHQAWGDGFLPSGVEAALARQYAQNGFTVLRRLKTEAEFRLGLLDLEPVSELRHVAHGETETGSCEPWMDRPKSQSVENTEVFARQGGLAPAGGEFIKSTTDFINRPFEGLMTLEAVTTRLSQLATAIVQAAHILSWRQMFQRHGQAPPPAPGPLCVLALGKLGGGELNYLSDIDLVFVYDPGSKMKFPGGLSTEAGYTAWCELFLQELGKSTAEGQLWRTDMRLRPEGAGGPLVMDLDATLAYYEGAAAPWELLAMARGRVVAGETALGEKILALCKERLMGLMRHQDVVLELLEHRYRMEGASDPESPNVKTGYGGIRDVEWAAFVLGAMASHRFPAAWPGQPVAATLAALLEAGLLKPEEHHTFLENYIWLRSVEHRIMLQAGQKQHTLPTAPAALGELAQGLGLSSKKFLAELKKRRAENRRVYLALFPETPETTSVHWLSTVVQTGQSCPELSQMFGPQAREAAQALGAFRVRQTAGPLYTNLVYNAMAQAAEPLLGALQKTPAPLLALRRFARFENLAASRVAFWEMVRDQPFVLDTLCVLAAQSGWLTRHLHTHPQWLDLALKPPTGEYRAALQQSLTLNASSLHRHDFALLCHWAQHTLSRTELEQEHTTAADRLVGLAMSRAKTGALWVGAAGKWGQGALLPQSDLDFLFFAPPGKAPAPLQRSAQRLLARLTDYTGEGALFEADARLRPFGTQGELVMAQDDALAYYRTAPLWEHFLWLNVRGLGTGAAPLADMRQTMLSKVRLKEEKLDELRHVLQRTFAEKNTSRPGKRVDIKHCPGGLFHMECAASLWALREGAWKNGPAPTLKHLREFSEPLAAAYEHLREVQVHQRVAADLPVRQITLGQEASTEVALAMGLSPSALLENLTEITQEAADLCQKMGL